MSKNDYDESFMNPDDVEEEFDLDDNSAAPEEDPEENVENETSENDVQMNEEEYQDDAMAVFQAHAEPVLCCDISKDDKYAVTGGQDDKAVVWDVSNGTPHTIEGHNDSVVAVKFNCNSSLLATADMSGIIQVFESPSWKLKYNFDIGDINWMLWHPIAENVLLAGTQSGEAWMWKLSGQDPQSKIFQGQGHGNVSARIFSDGKRIVMGYEDGAVRLFDLKDGVVVHSITGRQAHHGSVTTMDLNSDDTLLASGAVDSTVKIINTKDFRVLLTIDCTLNDPTKEPEDETTNSIESIAFSGKNILAFGTCDGNLEIWDVSVKIKRTEIKLESGISKIVVDKNNANQLFVSCLDASFMLIDMRNCNVLATKFGHRSIILDFAISSDSEHALTCSDDTTARVFAFETQ